MEASEQYKDSLSDSGPINLLTSLIWKEANYYTLLLDIFSSHATRVKVSLLIYKKCKIIGHTFACCS